MNPIYTSNLFRTSRTDCSPCSLAVGLCTVRFTAGKSPFYATERIKARISNSKQKHILQFELNARNYNANQMETTLANSRPWGVSSVRYITIHIPRSKHYQKSQNGRDTLKQKIEVHALRWTVGCSCSTKWGKSSLCECLFRDRMRDITAIMNTNTNVTMGNIELCYNNKNY
jgi:hypothetical protein